MLEEFETLAQQLGLKCRANGLVLATAESCTGGLVSGAITMVPGSSQWFDRGFVTYSNHAKQSLLGVSDQILSQYGAVSEETAAAMVEGALLHSKANLSLAITGVAGPDGGTPDKPGGTVCFAWGFADRPTQVKRTYFPGGRSQIRSESVKYSIENLLFML